MNYKNPANHPLYDQIMRQMNKRVNILHGAVRSTKTIISLTRFVLYTASSACPPGRLLIAGYTTSSIHDNICIPLSDLIECITGDRSDFTYKADLSGGQLLGREIFFVGCNNKEAESRLKGKTTSAGGYFDEPDTWDDDARDFAITRVDGDGSRIYMTCNANSPYHPVKKQIIDRAKELNYYERSFKLDDNIYMSEQTKMELKNYYTGLFYKRYIEGLWVAAEGVIYSSFDFDRHVGNFKDVDFDNYIVGVDYGVNNPCTFGLYGYNNKDQFGRVYLKRSYWHDSAEAMIQKTDSQYADDFEKFIANEKDKIIVIYIDPSATSFIAELRQRNLPVRLADNDVLKGIAYTSEMIAHDQYFIDTNCKQDLQEISTYAWDAKAQQRGIDLPLKQHDHTCDRTRYALYTHFAQQQQIDYKPISRREVGMRSQKGAW